MKISIIVPVFNVEKYIRKCLESIMNQTLKDFECLIIDDGSNDDSINLAKEVIKGDDRFSIFQKNNGGLSDARNYGLKKAKGDYVCFVDSDDYIDKSLLAVTYENAKKNNSDIVCFDLYYEYNGDLKVSKGADFEGVSSYQNNKEIIFINNSANNKLYNREFLKGKEFIKGMWYEDMAVIPVWIAQAKTVSYVSKPLYYYVQRSGSISHSANSKLFDIYKAIDIVKNDLKLSSYDVRGLYFHNCIIMTILRIKEINDKNTRIEYYKKNIDILNDVYSNWYNDIKKEKEFSLKQRIIFNLLKYKKYKLLDYLYN